MPSLGNNKVDILISTQADTSGTTKTEQALGRLNGETQNSSGFMDRLNNAWYGFAGVSAAAGIALQKLTGFLGQSVQAANTAQNAMLGLNSISRAYGQDAGAAQRAAQSLAKDGLMTVSDAATGLKNLLASGFNLDQATTLMNRFKDSAAFNRQETLSFGDAVRTATEGIKNGNSILVDNAGVTKNLSIILKEHGKSAQDVMNIQSDASVRQALYTGLLKETNAQMGDANKLAGTFAGSQASASAQTTKLKQELGTAIQTALLPLLKAITPIIVAISNWVEHHQKLAAAIAIGMVVFLGIIALLGVVATAVVAVGAVVSALGATVVIVVVAIAAALAVMVAWVVTHLNTVKGWFSMIGQFIPNIMRAAFGALIGIVLGPLGAIIGIFFGWQGTFSNAGKGLIEAFANGISGAFNKVKDVVSKGLGAVRKLLPFSDAKEGPLSDLTLSGRRMMETIATGVEQGQGTLHSTVSGALTLPAASIGGTGLRPSLTAGGGPVSNTNQSVNIQQVVLATAEAAKEFFNQIDQDVTNIGKGLTATRGAS